MRPGRHCIIIVALLAGVARGAAHGPFGVAPRPVTPQNVSWRATVPMVRGLDAWANARRPEALNWFRLAVGVAPNDSMAWHDLGVALYAASRYDDAFDAFLKERFLVPKAPSASYGVGECEFAQGHLADAERDLLVAVSMAPREWEYWQTLSEIFRAEHREDAAKAALARAVDLRPRNKRVIWSQISIERAILTLRIPPIAISR